MSAMMNPRQEAARIIAKAVYNKFEVAIRIEHTREIKRGLVPVRVVFSRLASRSTCTHGYNELVLVADRHRRPNLAWVSGRPDDKFIVNFIGETDLLGFNHFATYAFVMDKLIVNGNARR